MLEKKVTKTVDVWIQIIFNMISGAVAVIECSLLLVSTITALFSILNPKVKGVLYYAFVLLPISLLLPAVAGTHAHKAEKTMDD